MGSTRIRPEATGAVILTHTTRDAGSTMSRPLECLSRMRGNSHVRFLEGPGPVTAPVYSTRYSSPLAGRFLSIDPSPESFSLNLPQSLNRYSYVMGRGMNYIDPDGEKWFRTDDGWEFFEGVDYIEEIIVLADGTSSTRSVEGLDSLVTFDGSQTTLYRSNGSRLGFPSIAGKPDQHLRSQSSRQATSYVGPIPEGEWYFRPSEIQELGPTDQALGLLGRGKWPGGVHSWGRQRVWLHPAKGTDTRGRSGFTIHGGAALGSWGCIDLCGQADAFFEALDPSLPRIPVFVHYPSVPE